MISLMISLIVSSMISLFFRDSFVILMDGWMDRVTHSLGERGEERRPGETFPGNTSLRKIQGIARDVAPIARFQ